MYSHSHQSFWHRFARHKALSVAILLSTWFSISVAGGEAIQDLGHDHLNCIPHATFKFDGVFGQRVKADVEHWLLVTPEKNPGMFEMFVNREKNVEEGSTDDPTKLVPWAGEFVGKYLTSAVLAMRMSDDPRLRDTASKVVDRLIQLQAADGYIGPWPKKEQLMKHWDLWGHYHIMLGLTLWYEQTGDEKAFAAAKKAADLVCNTFLDTNQRVFNAGSEEMNMAILHGMAILYHKTGDPRYLRMAKEVLKDFERAGDYYRQGVKGEEYFRTPRPRWESLHSLQGMAELYRVTGDDAYRQAFLNHWASIRRFDIHNTGAFSSDEQATGNPFVVGQSIETCCVIAWSAIMVDALRLTGDSTIADDLELATFNAIAGAQHPSGDWCTYNTPMNGTRVPSHVHIAFQARPGAMFLNCCSVNGPRGLGMASDWGVMRDDAGLTVNYYGPMSAKVTLADGTPVDIEEATDYPIGDTVQMKIAPAAAKEFTLALRIPAWSAKTEVSLNGQPVEKVKPGEYLKLKRTWQPGDKITLRLDMAMRYESGDLEQAGKISLYRGPILLAADARLTTGQAAPIDVAKLQETKLVPIDAAIQAATGGMAPWLVVDVPTTDGKTVRLMDFANSGTTGKDYVTWLTASGIRPSTPAVWLPLDGAKVGPGPISFVWRKMVFDEPAADRHCKVLISDAPSMDNPIIQFDTQKSHSAIIPAEATKKLQPGKTYYWKVVVRNAHGSAESCGPNKRFTVDPTAPAFVPLCAREDGTVTAAKLQGDVKPDFGQLEDARGWKAAIGHAGATNDAIELDGKESRVRYQVFEFPGHDYSMALWVKVNALPTSNMGQIFSAWCRNVDDPLRLTVAEGKISARIEAGQTFTTEGVPVDVGQWHHLAVVKNGPKLTLYIDGVPRTSANVPTNIMTAARNFALGGNPNFQGQEYIAASMSQFYLYERALSDPEIKKLFSEGQGGK